MLDAPVSSRSSGEIVRLGSELLKLKIEPLLAPTDVGKFVAIDVEGGDYVVEEDEFDAISGLQARRPNASIYMGRVGYSTTCSLGGVR